MVQWAVELSQFDIDYKLRMAIKAQALAGFVFEFTITDQDLESKYWTMYTDGLSVVGIGGVEMILLYPEKDIFRYGVHLQFPTTNNEAKYEAVLTGLRIAKALGIKNLKLNFDSKLLVGQITKEYEAKEDKMKRYLTLTNRMVSNFDDVKITQVPREENSEVDKVARLESSDTNEG